MRILDTGGWSRIEPRWFLKSDIAIYVYDITNRSSFTRVEKLLRNTPGSLHNVLKAVIGNKADILAKRQVSVDEGQELASQYAAIFSETSARDGTGVEQLFSRLVKHKQVQGRREDGMHGLRSGFDDAERPRLLRLLPWMSPWICV